MGKPLVIALAGPAASGKGTLAMLIADAYGLAYLDTGSLYRGVAWIMLNAGADPHDEAAAERTARDFCVAKLKDADIRTREVGAAASIVVASPEVRAHRRWLELLPSKPALTEAEVLADLRERDARDAARADAPMAKAADAELLDTTSLTIDAAFAAARRVIDGVLRRCEA